MCNLRNLKPLVTRGAQFGLAMGHYGIELEINLLPTESLLLTEVSNEVISINGHGNSFTHLKTMRVIYLAEHRYMARLFMELLFDVIA